MVDAAVLLASRGSRVFPVGADKAPRTPRGHHDATSDPEVVRGWRWDGGIGLVVPPRTFVLDVDPRNDGRNTLSVLVGVHGPLPPTRTVRTRNDGSHFYFSLPDDRDLRGKLGPGVDIKKAGRGYVLVPPTPGYAYLRGGKPAPAPQWLLDELTIERRAEGSASAAKFFRVVGGTPYGLAALRNACEDLLATGEGGRRQLLLGKTFVLAGLCAGGELDEDKTCEKLLATALETGLSEKQALDVMSYAWRTGLQHPRQAGDDSA